MNPASLDEHLQRGVQFFRQGWPDQAAPVLLKALQASPKHLAKWSGHRTALATCAIALHQAGQPESALACQARLLDLAPADGPARDNFLLMLKASGGTSLPATADFRRVLHGFLQTQDMDDLAGIGFQAVLKDEACRKAVDLIMQPGVEQAARALSARKLNALLQSPLFLLLLREAIVPLPAFELLTQRLRKAILLVHSRPAWLDAGFRWARPERELIGALAQSMWRTEYACWADDAERPMLDGLKAQAPSGLHAGIALTTTEQEDLAVLALYLPWSHMPGSSAWLTLPAPAWDASLRPLIAEWQASQAEQTLAASITAITPIQNGVSSAVAQQYEDHPFPRWKHLQPCTRQSAATWLAALSPAFTPQDAFKGPIDVLVAGCGTGLEPLALSAQLDTHDLLAIDLSRSSLAYGQRQARDLAMDQRIRFCQADIMNMAEWPQRYDLITSSGVLHHLSDPLAGWRILVNLLRPGGVMIVSLYSEAARQAVVQARTLIAQQQWAADPDTMRALRATILQGRHPELSPLRQWRDFYSLSMFRDLVFHVQEHRYTVARIQAELAALGLRFVGMQGLSHACMAAFRQRFPHDPHGTDLNNWAMFEADHPDTFVSMYKLIAQKGLD